MKTFEVGAVITGRKYPIVETSFTVDAENAETALVEAATTLRETLADVERADELVVVSLHVLEKSTAGTEDRPAVDAGDSDERETRERDSNDAGGRR